MTTQFDYFLRLVDEQLRLNAADDLYVAFEERSLKRRGFSISDVERYRIFFKRNGIPTK